MRIYITILSFLSCIACNQPSDQQNSKPGILSGLVDSTVRPGTDFFDYANGLWIRNNPIPPSETQWGIGDKVEEELEVQKMRIIQQAIEMKNPDHTSMLIANFWKAGMDSNTVKEAGIQPLQPFIAEIDKAQTVQELMLTISKLRKYGLIAFYGLYVVQDEMNSEQMTIYLAQGGLGLPNRDYYFSTDSRSAAIRNSYPAYIEDILLQSGLSAHEAGHRAKAIFKLEKSLAEHSKSLASLRDPYDNYHKYGIQWLSRQYPTLNIPELLTAAGVHSIDSIIIGQPDFFKFLENLLLQTSLENLKAYSRFHLVHNYAAYLSPEFADAQFDFYYRKIQGAEAPQPRWKNVLQTEENLLGELIGRIFVKEFFSEKSKTRYMDMVEHIREAYKERITQSAWMSDSTKEKAMEKLISINKKVGYPDQWTDYSSLVLENEPYATQVAVARAWKYNDRMSKLGKPIDKKEWGITPQTYNAYYDPSNNEIVLPAAIFSIPGYKDSELDDAIVYGYAAASTIGHEFTHGFDDQGRLYDSKGNLSNWWTNGDELAFKAQAQKLVNQFNQIFPVDDIAINGEATLGENIADLGGVILGLNAFKKTSFYKNNTQIDGMSPLQRYFHGYALGWLYHSRPQQLAHRLLTDVHSPPKYRVNGILPNVDEFYEAFSIREGDPLFIADSLRARIW